MTSTTSFQLYYSGGAFNIDPTQSVGGLISNAMILNGSIDNLFDTSPPLLQTNQDFADYRAFYILNPQQTVVYNVSISASHSGSDDTVVGIWIPLQSEVQNIILSDFSSTISGSFILKLGNLVTGSISWNSSVSGLASNIQAALNALPPLGDVVVTTQVNGNSATFSVNFSGPITQNKLYPLLTVPTNLLSNGAGDSPISIQAATRGTPINDVAANIGFSNNPPVNALGNWLSAAQNPTINVGSLFPNESFFVWMERKIPTIVTESASNGHLSPDGFTIIINGYATSG